MARAQQPFLAGKEFTMADISLLATIVFMGFAKLTIPSELKTLIDWNARMQNRPSVKYGLKGDE